MQTGKKSVKRSKSENILSDKLWRRLENGQIALPVEAGLSLSDFIILGLPHFRDQLKRLKDSSRSEDKMLLGLINKAMGVLEQRGTAGERVPRDRWPKQDRKYDGIPNLFRYRLDRINRMTYFITKRDNQGAVVIIEAMDHTRYNRIFGYD